MSEFDARTRLMGPMFNRSIANWTAKDTDGLLTVIKSIQPFTITYVGSTTATATITAVDTANAVVLWGGATVDMGNADAAGVFPDVRLTNATTVTSTANFLDVGAVVYGTVLEFQPNILKSVQYGTCNPTAALSPFVVYAKSVCLYLGHNQTTASTYVQSHVTLDADGEGVTALNSADITTTSFVVFEFY